jgi:hypothetical protein
MPKLIVPKSNRQEQAIFEKMNIQLIDSITPQEFERVVSGYIDSHNVLNLATGRDNAVRCTTLEYFNNGLTVYIYSEGGGKIINLKANPRVCYTINDPYDPEEDYFGAIGLQVWGLASIFKRHDDPAQAAHINGYFRNVEALKKQGLEQAAGTVNYNIITIEPVKIRYLDLRRGFRNVVWQKEADG